MQSTAGGWSFPFICKPSTESKSYPPGPARSKARPLVLRYDGEAWTMEPGRTITQARRLIVQAWADRTRRHPLRPEDIMATTPRRPEYRYIVHKNQLIRIALSLYNNLLKAVADSKSANPTFSLNAIGIVFRGKTYKASVIGPVPVIMDLTLLSSAGAALIATGGTWEAALAANATQDAIVAEPAGKGPRAQDEEDEDREEEEEADDDLDEEDEEQLEDQPEDRGRGRGTSRRNDPARTKTAGAVV